MTVSQSSIARAELVLTGAHPSIDFEQVRQAYGLDESFQWSGKTLATYVDQFIDEQGDITLRVSSDEYNAIIAALRYWQANGQCEPDNRDEDMHDIATNSGEGQSLADDEIDSLIERFQSTSGE